MSTRLDPRPETFRSVWQEIGVVSIVCMAQLLNQAGATHCLPMMNELATVFPDVTNTDKLWFMAAFPLTSGAFILISGKFGDLYGLKKVLIYGSIWSTLWTLITGLSGYTDSVVFFCLCRGLHGLGVAYVLPSAIGVVGSVYPAGQRKAYIFSLVGAMAPVGATIGAVFGGLITYKGHWQWVFYSNSIAFALLGIASYFVIPDLPRHAPPEAKMDWIGALIGVAGLLLFNVATNQAAEAGWDSPYILVLFIVGILLLIGFFYLERRVKWPLLPPEVMNIHIALILGVVAFGWASFSVFLFYFWSFNMNLRGYNALEAGGTYATFAVFGVTAAVMVGIFIRRVRPSFLLFLATCGFLIGIVMLSQTPVHQSYFKMEFPMMMILSFGMDLSFPSSSLVLSDNLPKRHQGMASSLVSTMTNYAMSVSLGFAATAEVEVYKSTGDLLKSYRAATYVGIGIAAFGSLIALVLVVLSYVQPHQTADEDQGEEERDRGSNRAVELDTQHVSEDKKEQAGDEV